MSSRSFRFEKLECYPISQGLYTNAMCSTHTRVASGANNFETLPSTNFTQFASLAFRSLKPDRAIQSSDNCVSLTDSLLAARRL